jgi:hypothetical protein
MWTTYVIFWMFLDVLVGLLNFVTETQQQQGNITHTTTKLSQPREAIAAISSGDAAEQPRMDLFFIWDHLRNKGPIFPSIL